MASAAPTHAAGTADRPGRKGFEGSLVCHTSGRRCSRTVERHQPVGAARIGQAVDHRRQVGSRSEAVEVRPSEAASCVVVRSLAVLGLEMCLDRSWQLLDVVAPLRPCESSPPPSSLLSILYESL